MARYRMDQDGLEQYALRSPHLRMIIRKRAELGAKVAKALAPIGTDSPNPGEFRDSIHIERSFARVRVGNTWRWRMAYRIVADSRDAVWAEFGRTRTRRYRGAHALGRMAGFLNAPKRRRRA